MEDYSQSFKIILHAGNSKSKSREALSLSKKNMFQDCQKLLDVAREELNLSHQLQTELIQEEIKNDNNVLNMLMVHAQDHISSAETILELAEEMIVLRTELYQIRSQTK